MRLGIVSDTHGFYHPELDDVFAGVDLILHAGDVGPVEVQGSDRETALRLLRNEIRFRLEWCPCSAVAEDYVKLLVKDAPDAPWRGTVF